jgi:hypothetical protein
MKTVETDQKKVAAPESGAATWNEIIEQDIFPTVFSKEEFPDPSRR